MRYLTILFLLILCLLLTGCNGAMETDEVAWVISLGIDKADDGELLLTYRIAKPRANAGTSGEGDSDSGKKNSTLITIKAATLAEGRNLLNVALSIAVSMTHTTAIVIGERLAEAGVQEIIAPLFRFREYRDSTFLVVARGKSVEEIMQENKPDLETLVAKWVETYMYTYKESSYYLPLNLQEFYTKLKSGSGAPLAVGYGYNPVDNRGKSNGKIAGALREKYLPCDIPRKGRNSSEFAGTAVFKEGKLAGYLDNEETRALSILRGDFYTSYISVQDPIEPAVSIGVNFRIKKSKINVNIARSNPIIYVDVVLEGEITGISSGIMYEQKEYEGFLENQVSNANSQIMNMLFKSQTWGTDVADFGYYIRPKFYTLEEMYSYEWDKRFRTAEFQVNVQTKIRRTGLMRKTSPIRREAM